MSRTILVWTLLLAIYGVESLETSEYAIKGKWPSTVDHFDKLFPNNHELKLAAILTGGHNLAAFKRALRDTKSNYTKFPETLAKIDPSLYEEIGDQYDKLAKVYNTLDVDEKKPIDTLFALFKHQLFGLYGRGHGEFWPSDKALEWEQTYGALSEETRSRIRSKFPFLVSLAEYWRYADTNLAEIDEKYWKNIASRLHHAGVRRKILELAGPSPDYEKLLKVLKAEAPEIYAETQPRFEKARKAYETLPPKPKAFTRKALEWMFENRNHFNTLDPGWSWPGYQAQIGEVVKVFWELSEEERETVRKALPYLYNFMRRCMAISLF